MAPSAKVSKEAQANAQSYTDEIIKYHLKAITAQREGLQEALGYAIKCGKALNLAYENIKAAKGKWGDYLKEIKIAQTTASMYQRLADNEEFLKSAAMQKAIDEGAAEGALSIRGALNVLPKRERKASEKPKEKTLQPPNEVNEDEDTDEESEEVSEEEETKPLPSVETISEVVCNSGLSEDDLIKVATAIIRHVVTDDTPQAKLVEYQAAIAEGWPMREPLREAA
jgi:hypothetical protein